MVCKACGTSFEPRLPTMAKFCSARCRVVAWRSERERAAVERALAERERGLWGLLKEAVRLLGGEGGGG